jgi:DNA-binding LacI/PurR family transcriptional regulator
VVAQRAGTSIPTVSKALRGGTDVAPATRERIVKAANELGYTNPSDPHSADTAPTQLVDFVLSSVDNTWANRALGGVEAAAGTADLDVVITLVREGSDWAERVLRRSSIGAVLAVVGPTPQQWKRITSAGRPLVLLDPMTSPPDGVGSVGAMNYQGGRSVAEHLLSLGHRRFGVIDVSDSYEYSRARVDGFRSALGAAGIGLAADAVIHAQWDRDRARAAANELLARRERPTAVFACTETLALGAYDAAAGLGLSIPRDLSVVGYDDLPEAGWANPPMTTVQQPIAEMGAAALRMLLRLSEHPGHDHAMREELATRLIVRESTGPAPS